MHRLRAVYGDDMVLTAAYGDTSGDAQMIAAAEEKGYRVFTARP
jgi:phosphatidylglycerophosphatase C